MDDGAKVCPSLHEANEKIRARFWSHIVKGEPGECWKWTGPVGPNGRATASINGKRTFHYRIVWATLVGPIPPGAFICHHCDNPLCSNPEHLYVGDGVTNVRDMMERKRHHVFRDRERAQRVGQRLGSSNTWSKGERHGQAKLTVERTREILASKESSYKLADRFGVNATTIQRVRRGESWTW